MTEPPAPIRIVADPMRIAPVFANLISNASKYSHGGAVIRIAIELHPRDVAVTGAGRPQRCLAAGHPDRVGAARPAGGDRGRQPRRDGARNGTAS